MEIPGVLMCGVPGAGGFDAIFCIGLTQQAVENVETRVWSRWETLSVTPLLCSSSDIGIQEVEKI